MKKRKSQVQREIDLLVDWAHKMLVDVKFKREESRFNPLGLRIIIDTDRPKWERKVHLLHELGHAELIIIEADELHMQFIRLQAGAIEAPEDNNWIIELEAKAWDRGFEIATRLGLNIDKEAYEEYKAFAVGTYEKDLL